MTRSALAVVVLGSWAVVSPPPWAGEPTRLSVADRPPWFASAITATDRGFAAAWVARPCDDVGPAEDASVVTGIDTIEIDPTGNLIGERTCIPWETDTRFLDLSRGSLVATPTGFVFGWSESGIGLWAQGLDAHRRPLGSALQLPTAYLSGWGPYAVGGTTLVAGSDGVVALYDRHVAYVYNVRKRRMDHDATNPGDGALLDPAWSDGVPLGRAYHVDGAWDGERMAAVWLDHDYPGGFSGPRLMLRFLDGWGAIVGPPRIVATLDLPRFGASGPAIAATPRGWAVAISRETPDGLDDLFVMLLDREGRILGEQRVTDTPGVREGNFLSTWSHHFVLRSSPTGGLAMLYRALPSSGSRERRFLELAPDGAPLGEPVLLGTPHNSHSGWDLSWSNGRWGAVWRDSRPDAGNGLFFRSFPESR